MQTSIGSQEVLRTKRLRVHHLTIAGGIALAIAAAVGLGGSEGGGKGAVQPAPPLSEQVATGQARSNQLLVYLVGSAEEKRALERDVATSPGWFTETGSAVDTTVRVVVLDEDQEESLDTLARLLPEASISAGLGPALKLVDMR